MANRRDVDRLEDRGSAADRGSAVRLALPYYHGRPCAHGHTLRYTSCRRCVNCTIVEGRLFRRDHSDLASKQRRDWCRRNPDKAVAITRRWQRNNPEKVRLWVHEYRARGLNAEGSYTADEAAELFLRQGGLCAYCGSADDPTLDHKVPLSRGGSNSSDNLQWLCRSCNSSKKARTDEEYRLLLLEEAA
jgi:5-methylcytosine-specific restriction endonuclease McrA